MLPSRDVRRQRPVAPKLTVAPGTRHTVLRVVVPEKNLQGKMLPADLDSPGPGSNAVYRGAMADAALVFSAQTLGLMPMSFWMGLEIAFGELVTTFFQRKNNGNCRFPHKLYDALVVVDKDPHMFGLFGVRWLKDGKTFVVDKLVFARLLGIASVDGGLFHRQGNFPSHGFAEITDRIEMGLLQDQDGVSDVDFDRVRLLYHRNGTFHRHSDEEAVTQCKWFTGDQLKPQ